MSNKKESYCWSEYTNYVAIGFIALISIFYFYLSANNKIIGLIADDAVYLLMADYFSPYYSSLSQSAAFIIKVSQFPPLYPIFLALFGASSENIVIAHLVTTSCLIGAIIVYILWLRESAVTKTASLYLALIFICLPASFLMNIDLWSEHLYLFFTMSVLFLIEKANANKKYWIVVACIVGLIPLVRIVGVSFLAAFLIYLHIHKIHGRYKYFIISVFPILIWKTISISFSPLDMNEGPLMIEGILLTFYQHDFVDILNNLFFVQFQNLWNGWHECIDVQKNIWSGIICASVLFFALLSWLPRLYKKKIDSIYLLFYLIIIWMWPAQDHDMRFMFVVCPILFYYSYLSFSMLMRNYTVKNISHIINYASILLILIIMLPTNLYAVHRLFTSIPPELSDYRNTRYWMTEPDNLQTEVSIIILNRMIESYKDAKQFIPEKDCVYSVHQEQFMFYTRRIAMPPPNADIVTEKTFKKGVRKCEYVQITHTTSHPYYPGGYPINELGGNYKYLSTTRLDTGNDIAVIGALLQLY